MKKEDYKKNKVYLWESERSLQGDLGVERRDNKSILKFPQLESEKKHGLKNAGLVCGEVR
jgi:hypothetical protein